MPNPPEPHPESSDTLWTEHLQGCLRCRSLTEAVHAVCVHVDTREAELRSLLAYTTDKTADGRPRLSREFWELLLTKIGMAVMESVWEIMTLALRDKLPDIDLFRISLAEGAPKMCIGLWRRLTQNAELEPVSMGMSANTYADAFAFNLSQQVVSMAGWKPSPPETEMDLHPGFDFFSEDQFATELERGHAIVLAQGAGTFEELATKLHIDRSRLSRWRKDRLSEDKTTKRRDAIEAELLKISATSR
jgi:hypothetical protein